MNFRHPERSDTIFYTFLLSQFYTLMPNVFEFFWRSCLKICSVCLAYYSLSGFLKHTNGITLVISDDRTPLGSGVSLEILAISIAFLLAKVPMSTRMSQQHGIVW
jgi:hypothetical protein